MKSKAIQLFLLTFLIFLNTVFAKDIHEIKDPNSFLQGKFSPKFQESFVKIDKKHSYRSNLYLNKEAYDAFVRMAQKAEKEHINLKIISATRTFNQQKAIWERKWRKSKISDSVARAKQILQFSSMPGTSRHHWGTEIDINSLKPSYFLNGSGLKEYLWLKKNAKDFGFCQPYTTFGKGRKTGYNEERWHWSYFKISKQYTDYAGKYMKNSMLSGFDGSNTAKDVKMISNYILGVNKDCLKNIAYDPSSL